MDERSETHAGFKPEYFARLAKIEESNFWFRARNELIQWALRNYFPDAKSFFEVDCRTGQLSFAHSLNIATRFSR